MSNDNPSTPLGVQPTAVASPSASPSSELTDGALPQLTPVQQLIVGVAIGGAALVGLAVGLGVGLKKRLAMEKNAAKDMTSVLSYL